MNLWQWVICVGALGPLVYYLLAIYCTWDYFRVARKAPAPDGTFTPAVSILKPVRGVDREAYENFASFCVQDYPEYEILFCVNEMSDAAVPVVERVMKDFPERSIRIFSNAPQIGSNRKINNLVLLTREAKYEILLQTSFEA